MILIAKVRTSASKKINLMPLIRTLTISTTTFEKMKEKFDGFGRLIRRYRTRMRRITVLSFGYQEYTIQIFAVYFHGLFCCFNAVFID